MSLRLVGAGLPRTGTDSLRLALQTLLGEPYYHLREIPGPLCAALALPVPDEPFPWSNRRADWAY